MKIKIKTCIITLIFFMVSCAPSLAPLPAAPQNILFESPSGIQMTGRYYPAARNPAPVIVLIHGGGARLERWVELGVPQWLQNRGETDGGIYDSTDDPNRFAPRPADQSYGVFAFTVAGDWAEAGRAAVEAAKKLPGADPAHIAVIGGSVGADTATDACTVTGCIGVLAISPVGSINGVRYGEIVAQLNSAGKTAWCLNAQHDGGCPSAKGEHYRAVIVPGSAHSLGLLVAGHITGNWQIISAFLQCVFEQKC